MAMCLASAAGTVDAQHVLVEADSFDDYGGWVLDQQVMDQMGSPYLLAHGLGEPVADAATTVRFLEGKGTYRVWVRTRDWVAPWNAAGAPGRFQVVIDGVALEATFGTEGADWHWQDGGTVKIAKKEAAVALHDLTGFEGRCDAILFSADTSFVPPNAGGELATFRHETLGLPPQPETAGNFDFVVVGGGMAGACAALTAARLGLDVALIQDRPVLGGNNSSEVRVHLNGKINLPPYPALGNVVKELDTGLMGNAAPAYHYGDPKKLRTVRTEDTLHLFLNTHAFDVEMDGDRIAAVIAKDTRSSRELRFPGRVFADCTGDGTIGSAAGADYRMGREGRDETGEPMAPEKGDRMTLGSSAQWYSVETDAPSPFPECPWAMQFTDENCQRVTMGEWNWEVGMDRNQITEFEYIRDHALRAIYGNWAFLKNQAKNKDNYAKHKLGWVAYIAGKRESRRLLGDVILEQRDIETQRAFPDACVTTTWSIDLHYPEPKNAEQFPGQAFRAICDQRPIKPYAIPYRCLYSRNVANLMMAGRNISVTHVALGTVRVMRTGGVMGEVLGMAASLCREHGTTPRGVYEDHLEDLKALMTRGAGKPPLPEPGETDLRISVEKNTVDVNAGSRPLLRYRFRDVPFKPYVRELFTPEGVNILRDAPFDHLHHHALMFAINVDGINFWEEYKSPGRQAHRSFTGMRTETRHGLPCAVFTEHIDWVNPKDQAVLLEERRTIEALEMADLGATVLTWRARFTLPPGKESATLGGAHYHGLGMRFLTSMDAGGRFENAAGAKGKVVRGDELLAPADWCAYTAEADGKPVTVAMFDRPENLRHPAQWFTMHTPFAYLSATLNLWKEPLELTAETPLELCYAVAVWDGEAPRERIAQFHQRWLDWTPMEDE